jgi:hypothetical protein
MTWTGVDFKHLWESPLEPQATMLNELRLVELWTFTMPCSELKTKSNTTRTVTPN